MLCAQALHFGSVSCQPHHKDFVERPCGPQSFSYHSIEPKTFSLIDNWLSFDGLRLSFGRVTPKLRRGRQCEGALGCPQPENLNGFPHRTHESPAAPRAGRRKERASQSNPRPSAPTRICPAPCHPEPLAPRGPAPPESRVAPPASAEMAPRCP